MSFLPTRNNGATPRTAPVNLRALLAIGTLAVAALLVAAMVALIIQLREVESAHTPTPRWQRPAPPTPE